MADPKSSFRVPDPAWLGSRARNAARRPVVIGTIAVCVVLLAILAVVLAPKDRRRIGPSQGVAIVKVDTAPLLQALVQSQARVTSAESALVVVRQRVATAATQPVIDSLDPMLIAKHDSLTNILNELQSLIGKVESIPLTTSYRALATSPALFANARVRALLDSLSEVERDRDSYGSGGGADPMFVALTSRATEIGRAIEALAGQRRDSLRAQIARIATPSRQVAEARAAAPDTMPWVAERDSARSAMTSARAEIEAARKQLEDRARELDRAQQISAISASPFAVVIAAAVFGIVFGFAGALQSEFRRPTVAEEAELERETGARVMATVVPSVLSLEPDRRRADRLAPGYLDPKADSYQLAYLHVEQSSATPDIIAIIGDDPDVSAIVAMNIAAIAAEDARSVLVVDAAGRSEAIRSLLPFSAAGDLVDVITGLRSWVDATAHVSVGRDRTIDIVTGSRSAPPAGLIDLLHREKQRLGRYYDTVLVVSGLDLVPVLVDTESVGGTVITVSTGRTRLADVVAATKALRAKSHQIFGIVLWDAPAPRLAARPKRGTGGDRKAKTPPLPAPQPSAS